MIFLLQSKGNIKALAGVMIMIDFSRCFPSFFDYQCGLSI